MKAHPIAPSALATCICLFTALGGASAQGHNVTVVRLDGAPIYNSPSAPGKVMARARVGDAVSYKGEFQGMINVHYRRRDIDGWIDSKNLLLSPAIRALWRGDHIFAFHMLEQDVKNEAEPALACWLRFNLAYTFLALNREIDASRVLSEVSERYPKTPYAPLSIYARAIISFFYENYDETLRWLNELKWRYGRAPLREVYNLGLDVDHLSGRVFINQMYPIHMLWDHSQFDLERAVKLLKDYLTRRAEVDRLQATRSPRDEMARAEFFKLRAQDHLIRFFGFEPDIRSNRLSTLYRDFARKYPDSEYVDNAYFYALETCYEYEGSPDCPEREARYLESMLDRFPDSDLKGEILFELGRRYRILHEIYTYNPDPRIANPELGSKYMRKAKETLGRIIAELPQSEQAARARQALEDIRKGRNVYMGPSQNQRVIR